MHVKSWKCPKAFFFSFHHHVKFSFSSVSPSLWARTLSAHMDAKSRHAQRRCCPFLCSAELPNTIIHINATAANISRCPAALPQWWSDERRLISSVEFSSKAPEIKVKLKSGSPFIKIQFNKSLIMHIALLQINELRIVLRKLIVFVPVWSRDCGRSVICCACLVLSSK